MILLIRLYIYVEVNVYCLQLLVLNIQYLIFTPIIAVTAVNISGIGRGVDISGEHLGTSRYVQF